ncbi:MAG TPA: enoyl-CoA hydratase-related protein, partial [Nakamurella sp.]|nr:enoyl-CoA hydratase-related protein [Nakamurella sp.]
MTHARDQEPAAVSAIFDPARWRPVPGFEFTDITYHRAVRRGGPDGSEGGSGGPDDPGGSVTDLPTVRIAFDRPEVRNAFRPRTVDELYTALDHARMTSDVGCVLLTGNGPSPRDGGW